MKFVFGTFRLQIRIRTHFSDPDPNPAKRFGSLRIRIRLRIHNTALLDPDPGEQNRAHKVTPIIRFFVSFDNPTGVYEVYDRNRGIK